MNILSYPNVVGYASMFFSIFVPELQQWHLWRLCAWWLPLHASGRGGAKGRRGEGRRGEGAKGRRGEGAKGRRGEGAKGRRGEGAKGRRWKKHVLSRLDHVTMGCFKTTIHQNTDTLTLTIATHRDFFEKSCLPPLPPTCLAGSMLIGRMLL